MVGAYIYVIGIIYSSLLGACLLRSATVTKVLATIILSLFWPVWALLAVGYLPKAFAQSVDRGIKE